MFPTETSRNRYRQTYTHHLPHNAPLPTHPPWPDAPLRRGRKNLGCDAIGPGSPPINAAGINRIAARGRRRRRRRGGGGGAASFFLGLPWLAACRLGSAGEGVGRRRSSRWWLGALVRFHTSDWSHQESGSVARVRPAGNNGVAGCWA